MRKDYFLELENLINIYDIPNKKEILDKYQKRYDFGVEAGLSDEKIEEMLGTPKEVIKEYMSTNDDEADGLHYEIEIQTLADSIYFEKVDCDKVDTIFDNTDMNNYEIVKKDNIIKIRNKKTKFFSLNRIKNGAIRVEIPNDIILDKVKVSTTSGKIGIPVLKTKSFNLSLVTGNAKIEDVETEEFTCHAVSGDVLADTVITKKLKVDTVSGDVKIEFVVADEANFDTISGDIKIVDGKIGNIHSTAVSGDVLINGESSGVNVKNYVKGMFKK